MKIWLLFSYGEDGQDCWQEASEDNKRNLGLFILVFISNDIISRLSLSLSQVWKFNCRFSSKDVGLFMRKWVNWTKLYYQSNILFFRHANKAFNSKDIVTDIECQNREGLSFSFSLEASKRDFADTARGRMMTQESWDDRKVYIYICMYDEKRKTIRVDERAGVKEEKEEDWKG